MSKNGKRNKVLDEVREAAFFAEAREKLYPLMRDSAIYLGISPLENGAPDAKFCLELGMAVMLDKPLVVVAPPGRDIPAGLRRIAHTIVENVDMSNPQDAERLKAVLLPLMDDKP
jgi:hypothetical protein